MLEGQDRKYVPWDDPTHQKLRPEQAARLDAYEVIFGEYGINSYDRETAYYNLLIQEKEELLGLLAGTTRESGNYADIIKAIETKSLEAEKVLQGRGYVLQSEYRKLAKNMAIALQIGGEEQLGLLSDFISLFENIALPEEIENTLKGGLNSKEKAVALIEFISQAAFNDEILYKITIEHQKHIAQQTLELQKRGELLKEEFKGLVEKAVTAGILPDSARQNLSYLASHTIGLIDRLEDVFSSTIGTHHSFGKITADTGLLSQGRQLELRHVLFHEFLHAISGTSLTISNKITEGRAEKKVLYRKGGISLTGRSSILGYMPNTWLNEGTTELLAMELGGSENSESYVEEREELNRLMAAGLEKELVLQAYFENFSSEQTTEKPGHHFAKLVQRINQIEGEGGFNKLENKFLMKMLSDKMYDAGLAFADSLSLDDARSIPGAKVFFVNVAVGSREPESSHTLFAYFAKPRTIGNKTYSALDQWDIVREKILNLKKGLPRKVQISIHGETADTQSVSTS